MKVFVVVESYNDYDDNGSSIDSIYTTLERAMKRGDEIIDNALEDWTNQEDIYKRSYPWHASEWSTHSPLYPRERTYGGMYNPSVYILEQEVRE